MAGIRKRYSSEIKAKVALEAMRGNKTTNELASEFGVHPRKTCPMEETSPGWFA